MVRVLSLLAGFLLLACGHSSHGDRRAFLIAAENGDTHVVREQLEAGVQPDDVFQINDRTALFLASMNGHPDIVELLLSKGADVHQTHQDASLKMEVMAHLGHLRDAHAQPDSDNAYKKVDGTVVLMRTLPLNEADYERVLRLIDQALQDTSTR